VDITIVVEQFTPITDVVANGEYSVSDLRKEAHKKLIEMGKLPADAPISLIRLREKWPSSVGFLLRDGNTLRQQNISIIDGRQIAVQVH
jgi:hypothetical protein